MPRSRLLLSLSITSALVMLLALTGWCGGPVGAPQTYQQPGNFGGQAADADGGALSGFSLSGGVGSATINGADGTSPEVDFEHVGIKNSGLFETWDWRAVYQIPGSDCRSSLGRITGQWTYIYFKGSEGTYTGAPHPFLAPGQPVEAKLTLNIWSISGDLYLSNMWNSASAIRIGPRIQWMNYNDRFKLTNEFTNYEDSRSHTASMFGIGLVGEINLGKLVGMGKGFSGPMQSEFYPTLGLMATVGGSGNMRYDTWEVSLKVMSSSMGTSFMGAAGPKVGASVGIMGFRFKQSLDRDSAVSALPGAATRSSAADVKMTIPYGSVIVAF